MKKKYYILVLTFLCLLVGQNSFAQTTGGDFDDEKQSMHDFLTELFDREVSVFRTDPDTGYVLTVQGPGEGGGEHFGFVGFESSNDGTITVSWGGLVNPDTTTSNNSSGVTDLSPSSSSWSGYIDWNSLYSITIPYNPNGDCWSCNTDNDDSNDVASADNNTYLSQLPQWVQTNYLDFLDNLAPPTVSNGYSEALGDVVIIFEPGTSSLIGANYGQVPVEEVNDLKAIMKSNMQYDMEIFQFAKDHPGSGLKLLKAFTVNYPDGDVGQFLKDYYEPKNLCIEYPLVCGSDNTVNIDSNTINKAELTQAELTGLIQNMVGDYTVSVKHDYIGTISTGKSYKGKITRLYNKTTMHSYYYFMPYKNVDSFFLENTHYKIQVPVDNMVYPPASSSLDADGMPKNYHTVKMKTGTVNVFFGENNEDPDNDYCEGCTKIENNNDPKYPQLQKVLPKIKSLVLGNPAMLQYMITLSGYTRQQIINLLSVPNLKKMVKVTDIDNWGLYELNVTPDIIFVKAKLIASLETGGFKLGGENENLNGTSFFVAMVIVHELIHYGRKMNKLSQRVDGIHEAGFLFESWVFGHQLGITDVTNLATQYGWNF